MVLLPSQLKSSITDINESIFFSSALSYRYNNELEALMFFNPQQSKLRNTVSQLVERYGNLKIVKERGQLRLQIGASCVAQTLFCFNLPTDGELIGVVVYTRECIETLTIIHLAIREDYSMSGSHAKCHLVLRLIQKVQEIGARLKGVELIEVLYNQSLKKFPVNHNYGRGLVSKPFLP